MRIKYFFAVILIILGLSFCCSQGFCMVTEKNLEEQQTCGDYKITIYRSDVTGEGSLKILKKGLQVYSEEGTKFRIGLVNDDIPEDKLVRSCKDITGSGEPNLIVSHWSGGAHCCFSFYVFALGKDFKLINVIDGGDGDLSKFVDVDKDGTLEFVGNDWSFDYWHASFAGSPAPHVILKYRNGKYRLALDLMKKPLPTLDEEQALISEIKKEQSKILDQIKEGKKPFDKTDANNYAWVRNDVVLPSEVWGHMLDLIYTGHPKEAWTFLDKVWPQGASGKTEFIAEFKKQLSESIYWDAIKEVLELTPLNR